MYENVLSCKIGGFKIDSEMLNWKKTVKGVDGRVVGYVGVGVCVLKCVAPKAFQCKRCPYRYIEQHKINILRKKEILSAAMKALIALSSTLSTVEVRRILEPEMNDFKECGGSSTALAETDVFHSGFYQLNMPQT